MQEITAAPAKQYPFGVNWLVPIEIVYDAKWEYLEFP